MRRGLGSPIVAVNRSGTALKGRCCRPETRNAADLTSRTPVSRSVLPLAHSGSARTRMVVGVEEESAW